MNFNDVYDNDNDHPYTNDYSAYDVVYDYAHSSDDCDHDDDSRGLAKGCFWRGGNPKL